MGYHVGNPSRFSLTLTNQTVVNLAPEELNMQADGAVNPVHRGLGRNGGVEDPNLEEQSTERWPGHGKNCRCEEPIQKCADPDLSIASDQQCPTAASKIAKAMAEWADAVGDRVQQNQAIKVSLKTHVENQAGPITKGKCPQWVEEAAKCHEEELRTGKKKKDLEETMSESSSDGDT